MDPCCRERCDEDQKRGDVDCLEGPGESWRPSIKI